VDPTDGKGPIRRDLIEGGRTGEALKKSDTGGVYPTTTFTIKR
jgi:hypothetical protein